MFRLDALPALAPIAADPDPAAPHLCHACHAPIPAAGLCGPCAAAAEWGLAPEVADAVHPADREFWAAAADLDPAEYGEAVAVALGYEPHFEDRAGFADDFAAWLWERADRGEAFIGGEF